MRRTVIQLLCCADGTHWATVSADDEAAPAARTYEDISPASVARICRLPRLDGDGMKFRDGTRAQWHGAPRQYRLL